MKRISDNELMARAAAGDTNAFQSLVEKYNEKLIGFLHRFLNDHARALDLAQDTFLRLYKRLQERTPAQVARGKCSSLIFTIAANLGRDELRRRNVRKEVELTDAARSRPVASELPEDRMILEEERNLAKLALMEVPEDQRSFLIWREVQGMSYGEIAEVSGMPLGTVKSRINRARAAYRDVYLKLTGEAG